MPEAAAPEVTTTPDSVRSDVRRLLKAMAPRGARPARTHHEMGETARRQAILQTGILEDLTQQITKHVLRRLAWESAILRAIVQTKISQAVAYFRVPESEKAIGFRVVQKDRRRALTPAAAKRAAEIEAVLRMGGIVSEHEDTGIEAVWDGNGDRVAYPLEEAIRLLVQDSLVLDQAFISIEGSEPLRGKARNPVMFWMPEDGALCRYADRKRYMPRLRSDLKGKVEHVMLDPQLPWNVQREYARGEGAMWVRNRRTDQAAFGYGLSEVQQALEPVLGLQYSSMANRRWFTDSHIPQGMLVVPEMGDDELQDLRTEIEQEVGPDSPYKVPIVSAPKDQGVVQFVPFIDRTRLDMVFRAYAEFNIAEICAVFQMAPEEINFMSFGRGQATLSEADPQSILDNSQRRSLLPLVLSLTNFLSVNLVDPQDPDFEGIIQGLDARFNPEALQQEQLDAMRLQNGQTVNGIQALNDEPKIHDPLDRDLWEKVQRRHLGRDYPSEAMRVEVIADEYKALGGREGSWPNVPVNPTLFQVWMQEHQAEQQGAQQEMAGAAQDEMSASREDERQQDAEARQQMAGTASQESEHELGQRGAEAEAQRGGEMRIPGVQDALVRKAVVVTVRRMSDGGKG